MPFEDDEIDLRGVESQKKIKVSSQKSIFDKETQQKKPLSPEEFEKRARQINDKINSHKMSAAEISLKFKQLLEDKTLPQNKNQISKEIEREVLHNFLSLAQEINNDKNELEGMGSLSCIAFIFNMLLMFRDKSNTLEYNNVILKKEIEELKKIINQK